MRLVFVVCVVCVFYLGCLCVCMFVGFVCVCMLFIYVVLCVCSVFVCCLICVCLCVLLYSISCACLYSVLFPKIFCMYVFWYFVFVVGMFGWPVFFGVWFLCVCFCSLCFK